MKKLIYIVVLIAIVGGVFYWVSNKKEVSEYNPAIDSVNFVSGVNNKYFTLKSGTKFTYENKTPDGLERIEVLVTDEIKEVLGIKMTVVWDRVWLDDVLIEDTKDWYAQDKEGNVWYFGETVDNYEDGVLKDHSGSWEAGIAGALPGIIMKADPKIGGSYRQEYFTDEAEDMGEVVALGEKVSVPFGEFDGCLKTRDWSLLESSAGEYKYYCPEVGFVVLEEEVNGPEKVELVNVSKE